MKNGMKKTLAALTLCMVVVYAYAYKKSDALIEAAEKNNAAEVQRIIADDTDFPAYLKMDGTVVTGYNIFYGGIYDFYSMVKWF